MLSTFQLPLVNMKNRNVPTGKEIMLKFERVNAMDSLPNKPKWSYRTMNSC